MLLTRPARAVILIGLALLALAAGVAHFLLPAGLSAARTGAQSVHLPQLFTTPATRRPYGVLYLDGQEIPTPHLQPSEVGFLHTLVSSGVVIRRVDPSPWDRMFDQAVVDLVTTDQGDVTIIAAEEPGHPLWVCPAAGGAVIGGGDPPAYEIGAGGDVATLQLAGAVHFGRVGDVLALGYDQPLWQRIQGLASPVSCPAGQ